MSPSSLEVFEKLFMLTAEERVYVLRVLVEQGQEALGSMGDDTPLPLLSNQVRSIYDSFRQQFAQVTNPAIDPIREQVVMSLRTAFGVEKGLFKARAEHARRVELQSPVLSESRFSRVAGAGAGGAAVHPIGTLPPHGGGRPGAGRA